MMEQLASAISTDGYAQLPGSASNVAADSAEEPAPVVTVRNIAGVTMLAMSPAPDTVTDVKAAVLASKDIPVALQKMMLGSEVLQNDFALCGTTVDLTFVLDESPLFAWEIAGNPDSKYLEGCGSMVSFSECRYDYINVITQEPVRQGFHFFEFVMHKVGDEQWCGVSPSPERAGNQGERAPGWCYYCGGRYDTAGGLHAPRERRNVKAFEHVKEADTIGILLDMDEGILAFMLNGIVQGACAVPKKPMYLSTTLDQEDDRVELRKPLVEDAPLDLIALRALPLLGRLEVDDQDVMDDLRSRMIHGHGDDMFRSSSESGSECDLSDFDGQPRGRDEE